MSVNIYQNNSLVRIAGGEGGGQNNIAPLEVSPSTSAYEIGDYLIYGYNLYKVIDDIAVNDILVIDENIERTTVGNELKEGTGGNGNINIAKEESSPATSEHPVDSYLMYNDVLYKAITDIQIGDELILNTNIEQTTVGEELEVLNSPVFGFIEHMDILDPSQRIEYIEENQRYSPITVTMGGGYNLGSWSNFPWLIKNKPYMVKKDGTIDYALNSNDYTKKLDSTASDISNSSYSGAGAFSWAETIYIRRTINGNDRIVEFSLIPREGFEPTGFVDKNGNVLEGRWIPMFYASMSGSEAKTVAGIKPGGDQTTEQQKSAVDAVGSKSNFFGGSFVETLIDLMIMFAKTTDLQDFYGYGACNGYSTWNTNIPAQTVVGGGQFYGTTDKQSYNKIFHSVVLGSYMVLCRDPYEICVNGTLKVSKDYHIDLSGNAYTNTGKTYSSTSGWIYPDKYSNVDGYGSVPTQPANGSTSTGGCDGLYIDAGIVAVCVRFGDCRIDLDAGPRARTWDNSASNSRWHLGFAILLDPPPIYKPS